MDTLPQELEEQSNQVLSGDMGQRLLVQLAGDNQGLKQKRKVIT